MTFKTTNDRFETIYVEDLEIHEFDFSNVSEEGFLVLFEFYQKIIEEKAPNKSYHLLNIRNSPSSPVVLEASKKFLIGKPNSPNVTVLYHANKAALLYLKILNVFSKNKTVAFASRDEAIQYLVAKSILNKKT